MKEEQKENLGEEEDEEEPATKLKREYTDLGLDLGEKNTPLDMPQS